MESLALLLLILLLVVCLVVLRAQIRELKNRVLQLERSLAELRQPVEHKPEPAPVTVQSTGPSWAERLRTALGNEEWEALVGGSLLNKAGALVLVIGIALFLAYSFGYMTAGGRATIALCTSMAVLGTGVWMERRAAYRMFARGLIGAGWAALYATAYAIYAVPAARIIHSLFVGSLGLLLVAAGMIAHSLLYRAQATTAVAYFAAFAALAATPSTPFAVVSLIPLAASLLYLASRLGWHGIALFGLFATYGTCISRPSSNAPLGATQALFLTYWLLFEAFDLMRTRRRLVTGGLEWIVPLNAFAFLFLSYRLWAHHAADRLWLTAAYGAGLYLASTLLRAFLRPPSTFKADENLVARIRAGSYEGHLIIAATLAGLAIIGRVPGIWISVGLALEAEILYLLGVRLQVPFLRTFGRNAFVFSLLRMVLGHATWNWTPPALFHAFLFYVNRVLQRPNTLFSSAAAALIAAVLAKEAPERFTGTSWVVFSAILFEIGFHKQRIEFRVQAYALALGGFALTAFLHAGLRTEGSWPALSIAVNAVYAYAIAARSFFRRSPDMSESERGTVVNIMSACGAIAFMIYLWTVLPDPGLLTVAWGIQGLGLLAVGFPLRERVLRLQGLALLLICILKLFVYDLRNLETVYRILSFIALGLIMLCVSWVYTRYREHIRRYL